VSRHRTHYRNGDEITMQWNGCDGCSPTMIQGVACHENGCPDAWRDSQVECEECGCGFHPQSRHERFCSTECYGLHYGFVDAMSGEDE
jgi:hypothetical protein